MLSIYQGYIQIYISKHISLGPCYYLQPEGHEGQKDDSRCGAEAIPRKRATRFPP